MDSDEDGGPGGGDGRPAAAAKQLLTDGGHAELLHTLMQMVHGLSTKLEEVKDEVRSGNVTLESIAIGELDTPRLVFIQPADVESKSMAKRLASKLKGIAKDKFRLSFLDPVTGVCVPTGNDGLGYIITLPKEWLVKHGKANGVLARRQELPEAAFISVEELMSNSYKQCN